jgi:hypothetical protein
MSYGNMDFFFSCNNWDMYYELFFIFYCVMRKWEHLLHPKKDICTFTSQKWPIGTVVKEIFYFVGCTFTYVVFLVHEH